MQQFAVFGNPISHSKSPIIHRLFAEQTQCKLTYEAILSPLDKFEENISTFFTQGGWGANITTPFKERAYHFVDELTARAKMAGAVNTIKRLADNRLLGDNTDGVGLLSDLQRLEMINPRDHVLLIGAGGAARGVIQPLLELGCSITVVNRTVERAEQLASEFSRQGTITACNFSQLSTQRFDLLINATSAGLQNSVPELPSDIIDASTKCYDMFYQIDKTPFLSWTQQNGAKIVADGLGMLVAQAAHAYFIWIGIMPDVTPVLSQLRSKISVGD